MSSRPHGSKAHTSSSGGFAYGLNAGLPIFLGYLPVGAAFGVLAVASGWSPQQATACSALVLAGAGQFVGLALGKAGAGVLSVIVTTGVINLRYLLFGASISPRYRHATPLEQAAGAFTLTDETYAVNSSPDFSGGVRSMLGVGAVSWVGWVGGTALGALGGSLVGDPSRWGVEFAMPAMFTALLVGQVRDRRDVAVAALAAVLAAAFALVLPGRWYVVAASLAAATVAAVLPR